MTITTNILFLPLDAFGLSVQSLVAPQGSDEAPCFIKGTIPPGGSGPYIATRQSRAIEGAGLGLSIVSSVCTAHGGTVYAENLATGGCVLLPSSR